MSDTQDDRLRKAATQAYEQSEQERTAVAQELRDRLEAMPRVGAMPYVAQPAPGYNIPGLWHCFGTEHRSGYAAHAIALQWVIANKLGIRMQLYPHRTADIDIERFPPDRYDMLFSWLKDTVGVPRAAIVSYPPETALEMAQTAPKLVPYVAFEGTKISAYGKRLCERGAFDQIWVVSDFVKSAYVAAGVAPETIVVVRPMLCGGPWPMPSLDVLAERRRRPVTHDDPFIFGTIGTWQKRKGMHDLARAYFSAFKRDEPVQLTIRTSAFGDNLTIRELRAKCLADLTPVAAEFGDMNFPTSQRLPRIHFEFGTKPTDLELIDWTSSIDCYVNPSYGEGLGIPQTWAKALGVPLVSSGFGAVGEFLREVRDHGGKLDHEVDFQLTRVDPIMCRLGLMYAIDTEWGIYDPVDFGVAMRRAMAAGRVVDRDGATYVRQAFGEDVSAERLRSVLTDLLGTDTMTELYEGKPVESLG